MTRRTSPLFSPLAALALLSSISACEVAADFDPKKLDKDRTVGPTPLPTQDGATASAPDAEVEQDGALIKPPESDAEVVAKDAGRLTDAGPVAADAAVADASVPDMDAAVTADGGAVSDAGLQAEDASLDAQAADAARDAGVFGDISFADAALTR